METIWMLIIVVAVAGGDGVADVKVVPMMELQCKQSVNQLRPLSQHLQAACIGESGEVFAFPDLSRN